MFYVQQAGFSRPVILLPFGKFQKMKKLLTGLSIFMGLIYRPLCRNVKNSLRTQKTLMAETPKPVNIIKSGV